MTYDDSHASKIEIDDARTQELFQMQEPELQCEEESGMAPVKSKSPKNSLRWDPPASIKFRLHLKPI
jgi:hypothetical protein